LVYTLDDLDRREPTKDLYQIPLYLKLTVRCLTSLLRQDLGVGRYAKSPQNIQEMMRLVKALQDEEVVANGCKCVRIALRDEQVWGADIICNFLFSICK
jgi:hypothetical protein